MNRLSPQQTTQRHGLLVAITLGLFSSVIFSTHQEASLAKQFHQEARSKLDRLRQKQRDMAAKTEERSALASRYLAVISSPSNTPPSPGKRAEGLQKIQQDLSLQDFSYELQPAVPDTVSPHFQRRPMKIRIHLRHEEELLRFFDALNHLGQSLPIIRYCSLTRLESGLSAACEIDDFNLSGLPSP